MRRLSDQRWVSPDRLGLKRFADVVPLADRSAVDSIIQGRRVGLTEAYRDHVGRFATFIDKDTSEVLAELSTDV